MNGNEIAYIALTVICGLVPVGLYIRFYFQCTRGGKGATPWWGGLEGRMGGKRLFVFFWVLSAASYIYLWSLTISDPTWYDYVQYIAFPLVAAAWAVDAGKKPKSDAPSEPGALSGVAVIGNAILSLLFVARVGQHTKDLAELQLAAALMLVVQHVIIDGVLWPPRVKAENDLVKDFTWRWPWKWPCKKATQTAPLPTKKKAPNPVIESLKRYYSKVFLTTYSFRMSAHGLAAVVHIGSAVGLYAAGAWKAKFNPRFYDMHVSWGDVTFEPNVWLFNCTANFTAAECPDDKRNFYRGGHGHSIPLLDLAAVFAVWSGLHHLIVNCAPLLGLREWIYTKGKWYDYMVSAPVMLVVISSTYGSKALPGIVFAPVLLFLLLVGARLSEGQEINKTQVSIFVASVVLYVGVWVPAGISFEKVTQPKPKTPDAGSAPSFVWAFLVVTILIFSSFVVVRALEYNAGTFGGYERSYLTLSAIAKTTLHLFVGLTVIQTGLVLDESSMDRENTLLPGLLGAAVIVAIMATWARGLGVEGGVASDLNAALLR